MKIPAHGAEFPKQVRQVHLSMGNHMVQLASIIVLPYTKHGPQYLSKFYDRMSGRCHVKSRRSQSDH
jgi:hypothetical protein